MFKNTLMGLSENGKKKFDAVCVHLNGVMNRMGIRYLDGEEDQILIDLWMDTFPFKLDEDGKRIPKVVRERVVETVPVYDESGKVVGGKNVVSVKEKLTWELDFSRSLIDVTSVGIYKWRGEQLLLNKIKYLYGDSRVRKWVNGKPAVEIQVDAWGNERIRAVYEESSKVSKRDISRNINECDLVNSEGEAMTFDDIGVKDTASSDEFDMALLRADLERNLSSVEMGIVDKLLDGNSVRQVQLSDEGVTSRTVRTLRAKIARLLGRSDLVEKFG